MTAQHVALVRRFHRAVTQRAGLLSNDYLRRGRPLGEARLLFEIGPSGASVKDLRIRLDLDSGYLSRMLSGLQRQGLVRIGPSNIDGRQRVATLTERGFAEFNAYERASDDLARNLLSPLEDRERDRLVAAMVEVERLLALSSVTFSIEPADSRDGIACLTAYFDELNRRFDNGFDPGGRISDHARALASTGQFLLARRSGSPIGCVALLPGPDGTGEIKRLWVAPDARGIGLARALMERIETRAIAKGLARLRLDTNRALTEARMLYLRLGYRETSRFNDNPYAHHWFEKVL